MKKILCIILTLMMILATSTFSFGAVKPDDGTVSPQYAVTGADSAVISISGSKASYEAKLRPSAGQTISYVKATLNLVNSKGTVVKTKTETIYLSGGYFKISDSKTLTAKGTYHAEYTLKVYKSGSLVETVKGKSNNATY